MIKTLISGLCIILGLVQSLFGAHLLQTSRDPKTASVNEDRVMFGYILIVAAILEVNAVHIIYTSELLTTLIK